MLPKEAYSRNQIELLEGRAAVASKYAFLLTATTKRGPPGCPTTWAHNAHM